MIGDPYYFHHGWKLVVLALTTHTHTTGKEDWPVASYWLLVLSVSPSLFSKRGLLSVATASDSLIGIDQLGVGYEYYDIRSDKTDCTD